MKIAVRMDDITPDMDWKSFSFFVELFQQVQITPLLGIVPEHQDEMLKIDSPREDFYEYIKELQKSGYVLAMHGCHHTYTSSRGGLFPLNYFSEFAGLPYERQRALLEEGVEVLKSHGITPEIFMAPGHSYDRNTLRALVDLGITKVTDGFGQGPYHDWGVDFYPISFRMQSSLKRKKGVTCMVIHANTVNEKDRENYRKIFTDYRESFISYEEYLKIPVKRRNIGERYLEYLLANMKRLLVKIKG